jgi:hypothetical protein
VKPALLFTTAKIPVKEPLPPIAKGDVPKRVESLPRSRSLSIIEIVARRMDTMSRDAPQVQTATQIRAQDRPGPRSDAFNKWGSRSPEDNGAGRTRSRRRRIKPQFALQEKDRVVA